MRTTTLSRGNAGSIIAELALENLERRIGRKINDLGERPVREGEVITHLDIVLTLKESLS
jgi:hypothetical protein